MSAFRCGAQIAILSAIPVGEKVTVAHVAAQTGFSSKSAGALLRNARRDGVVEKAGQRCEKRNGHWQMVTLWRRTDSQRREPKTGIDDEDLQWMAYWQQRYRKRLHGRMAGGWL